MRLWKPKRLREIRVKRSIRTKHAGTFHWRNETINVRTEVHAKCDQDNPPARMPFSRPGSQKIDERVLSSFFFFPSPFVLTATGLAITKQEHGEFHFNKKRIFLPTTARYTSPRETISYDAATIPRQKRHSRKYECARLRARQKDKRITMQIATNLDARVYARPYRVRWTATNATTSHPRQFGTVSVT